MEEEIVLSNEQIQTLILYKRQLLQYMIHETDAKIKKCFNRLLREVIKIDDFLQVIENNKQEIALELPDTEPENNDIQ